MKFKCTECRYSVNREKRPEVCPYCGSKNVMEKEVSAEKLVSVI